MSKRTSFLEREREELEKTKKLWAEQDAQEAREMELKLAGSSAAPNSHINLETLSGGSQQSMPPVLCSSTLTATTAGTSTSLPSLTSHSRLPLACVSEEQVLAQAASVAQSAAAPGSSGHAAVSICSFGTSADASTALQSDPLLSQSPAKSVTANSADEVPEHLRETIDIHSLDPGELLMLYCMLVCSQPIRFRRT